MGSVPKPSVVTRSHVMAVATRDTGGQKKNVFMAMQLLRFLLRGLLLPTFRGNVPTWPDLVCCYYSISVLLSFDALLFLSADPR